MNWTQIPQSSSPLRSHYTDWAIVASCKYMCKLQIVSPSLTDIGHIYVYNIQGVTI